MIYWRCRAAPVLQLRKFHMHDHRTPPLDSGLQHVAWFAMIFDDLTFLATLTGHREGRLEWLHVRPGPTLLTAIQRYAACA